MSFFTGPAHWSREHQTDCDRAALTGQDHADELAEHFDRLDREAEKWPVHLELPPMGCKCVPRCEMPCHDRLGIAPACKSCGCAPFPPDQDNDEIAA